MITYPATATTNALKLACIYSLLEQMRLEHNRVGAIAKSDWAKYRDNWAAYGKVFMAKQLPLLEEQTRLRGLIRLTAYTNQQWSKLSVDQKHDAFTALFGDKTTLKVLPTVGSAIEFDQLRRLVLTDLRGQYVDPTQDFTTYTEVDPDSTVTVSASKITGASVQSRSTDTYVYKDFTASHFNAIDWLWECYYTSGSANYEIWAGVGPSNTVNDISGFASTDASSPLRMHAAPDLALWLYRGNLVATDSSVSLTVGVLYYPEMVRAAASDTISVKIYTDNPRVTLLDTLSVAGFGTATRYRYAYGTNSYNSASTNRLFSGYVQNLDLQEAGGPTTYNETITDGIKAGETIGTKRICNISVADGIKSGDTDTSRATFQNIVSDGVKAGDTRTSQATFQCSLAEGIKSGDTQSPWAIFPKSVTDGTKLAEAISHTFRTNPTLADGLKVGETISITGILNILLSDKTLLADLATITGTMGLSLTDGVKLGDLTGAGLAYFNTITDGVKLAEAISHLYTTNPSVSDGVKIGDTITNLCSFVQSLLDGIKAGDTPTSRATFQNTVNDGVKIGDSLYWIYAIAVVLTLLKRFQSFNLQPRQANVYMPTGFPYYFPFYLTGGEQRIFTLNKRTTAFSLPLADYVASAEKRVLTLPRRLFVFTLVARN